MSEINEYINKLELYNKMVKAGKIEQNPKTLALIVDKMYISQENEDKKK